MVEVENVAELATPIWVCCQYPITIDGEAFKGAPRRGTLPKALMEIIRSRLGTLFMLDPF